jgi:uncharacterized protein with PQ loop repeat
MVCGNQIKGKPPLVWPFSGASGSRIWWCRLSPPRLEAEQNIITAQRLVANTTCFRDRNLCHQRILVQLELSTMAPQGSIPVAANVLGTIGTVCWCVQLLPQIWRNFRTKSTEGLPAAMMLIWSISGVPFGVYATAQRFTIPLIVQPQCFCVLCAVSWAQCLVYGK